MASFVDNPNVLGSFTPYKPEEPVDALTYVGMQKQQQFYQGLNKVQGEINYVAALPLIKQDHKDYMNSLLGQVKDKVQHSIASDFSDQRLTNQIGSLVKHVGDDPIIENGVASTMKIQSEDARMAKDKADGKFNPANEGVYNMQKQSWLNDHDLKSSFGGEYFTPVDYNKKALEVLKIVAQNPNLREADIPFKRDAMGGYLKDKRGNPVLDEVMVREKYSGLDPQKIQQALMATFDEADINQLNIEGVWHYRNSTPDDLYHMYASGGQENINSYNASIAALKMKKLEKGADVDNIQQSIEHYQDLVRKEQNTLDQVTTKDIAANPEAFKARLFTNSYLSIFSKAFSFENKTSQIMENPYQSYRLNVDRSNREWAQLAETQRYHSGELGLRAQEMELSKARLSWEMSKPGKGVDGKGTWGSGVVFNSTTPVNDNDSFKALNQDIAATEQSLKTIKDNVINQSADVPGNNSNERERNLEAIYDNFDKTGSLPLTPDLINYVKQRKIMERDMRSMQKLATNASNYSASLTSGSPTGQSLNNLVSATGYNIHSSIGDLHFTPAEAKNILYKASKVDQINTASGGQGYIDISKRLTPKEMVFYDRFFGKKFKDSHTQDLYNFYSKNFRDLAGDINKNPDNLNAYINQHTDQYLKKSGGVPLDKEEVRQEFAADLNAMIADRKDSDSRTISEWATDKSTTFSIQAQGANDIVLTAAHKGDTKSIRVAADDAKKFFGTDFTNPYDNVDQTIKRFGSTNFAGIYANPENAYFQTFDMRVLSDKYAGKVKADIIPIPNTSSFKIKMWYYNSNAKSSDKWQSKDVFQKDGTGYNLQTAYQYITEGIGDNTIESVFK